MKLRPIAVVLALVTLAGGVRVGMRGAGPLPPLGPFLDPARGVWAAATYADLPKEAKADIPGLTAPVEIRYDARSVPHIFATTEEDALRALGWVVARDRLFQMDLQARAGAGTLSELAGKRALDNDREPRALGMGWGAERQLASIPDSSLGRRLLDAYAQGVNAWIDQASFAELPLEYKLLGARPAKWSPLRSLNLFARMGWTLAYMDGEEDRAATAALVGREAARALFPDHSPLQEPIQPNGSGATRTDFSPIPPPGNPDAGVAALTTIMPRSNHRDDDGEVGRLFASNNWAVAPSRSRSGHALLAGDPHLELTLPSIWYEVHVVVPGKYDVYGVTIPGAPGVIIGFNRDVAWSLTNTGADVMDFYKETVDDTNHPRRYRLDGRWKDLELREEKFLDARGNVLSVDTVRFTHRGPIRQVGTSWVSLRWTVNEPNGSIAAFFEAQHATTATGFLDAFARNYFAPAQNTIVADRQGTIAIRSTGHYPIRPDSGDGLVVRDGSLSSSDWQGYWPVEQYPQAVNPAQGYLASANQEPIDPRQQPRYMGFEASYEPWRAMRINALLRATDSVSVDDMRRFQTDPGSARADYFVPYFLVAAEAGRINGEETPALVAADSLLRAWDRRYTRQSIGTAVFERALAQLIRRTWDELIPPGGRRPLYPSVAVLAELMPDSASAWWDDRRTSDVVETRDAVLRASLVAAYDTLVKEFGPPTAKGWAWEKVAPRRIDHLLRLPGFAVSDIPVQGGRGTLNPSTGGGAFGSSWRMVVEMGDRVRAIGTYPGGQSGNPVSSRYADRIKLWSEGNLELLVAPPALDSMPAAQVTASATLSPKGGKR